MEKVDYSVNALLVFCDEQEAVNPESPGRYRNWKTAVRAVRGVLTEAQRRDVREIDIPTAVELYAGQKQPKPKTKREYLGRLKAAITSFLESSGTVAENPVEPQTDKPESKEVKVAGKPRSEQRTRSTEANTFTFPIRKDFIAQVILPIDLTAEEAQRVCKLIEVLPLS